MDTKDKIITWFLSDNTGISSEAIVAQMTGNDTGRTGRGDHPRDASDFGRCCNLLETVPEFKDRISEMAERSSEWAALVKHWDELTQTYIADTSSCYYRIKEILDAVPDKKGIDLGNGVTIY